MIVTVDLRMIFDEDEQLFIVGCHECAQTSSASIKEIPKVAIMLPEFAMTHIKSCGKKRM